MSRTMWDKCPVQSHKSYPKLYVYSWICWRSFLNVPQEGNTYVSLSWVSNHFHLMLTAIAPVVVEDPCDPDPCGLNSRKRQNGDRCDCSCLPDFIGSPPNCRPECTINSDCPTELACITRHCQDPCPGLCGINAKCRVRNHIPICICNPGYVGDPFSQCRFQTSKMNKHY